MNPNQLILEDFINKHPLSAAQALEKLEDAEIAEFIQDLEVEKSLKLLDLMNASKAAKCFMLLPPATAKTLLESSDYTLAEALCRHFDTPYLDSILGSISPRKSAVLKERLAQVPHTVGVFMVPVIVVNKEMTVQDAVEIIRGNRENLESYLYVVDLQGSFEGAVRLKELLLSDSHTLLEELMITQIPRFFPETPIKSILDHPAWYEYRYIPVIDKSEKLLGTLPYWATRETTTKASDRSTKEILETGGALGELYLIGLTALLQSVGK